MNLNLLKIALLVLALAGSIAVAGCGGDDEETLSTITEETTEGPLSPEDYAIKAQTVIVSFANRFGELAIAEVGDISDGQFRRLADQAEGETQDVIEEFDALEPPEEAREGHDQILAALEDFSSKLTDVSDAASSGGKPELRADLQAATVAFQSQLLAATETLNEAGIDIGESPGSPSGG